MRACLGAVLIALPFAASAVTVGTLSSHDTTAWESSSPCKKPASNLALVKCNLQVYEHAVATAAAQGVDLLVLPEGYGLSGMPSKSGYFEEVRRDVGVVPCGNATLPVQSSLSCAAKKYGVAVAMNFFASLPNGTRRITEVIYDNTGAVVTTYDKTHLFPIVETSVFTKGPNTPTTFELLGRRWGILICYEGFYPDLTGDWSQMESLKAQGAEVFVWSVGGTPMSSMSMQASVLAKRFGVVVAASEEQKTGVIAGAAAAHNVAIANLTLIQYTAAASLAVTTLPN